MNYAVVGAFVLALSTALVVAILWLASGGALQTRTNPYLAMVDESVAGLNPNAAVKFNGVDVGKVARIDLDPANPDRVNLLFAINDGTPIRQDTVAVLKTQGLTGIAYVELSGGSLQSPPLQTLPGNRYPIIQTKASLSARLENVMTTALTKLDDTTNNINALLSPQNQAAVQSALADIATVARTVAARKDDIDNTITQAGRAVQSSERAATQVAAQAGALMERIGRSADAVGHMGNEFAQTGRSATRTVDAVGEDLTHFTSQTLPQIDQLVDELTTLSSTLRRVSEQTERDPRSLIFGRQPTTAGPGETPAPTR